MRCSARGRRTVRWRRAAAQEPGGTTPPGTQDPGTTTPPPAGPPAQGFTRDDAGFNQALSGNRLQKYEEGASGFGDYAYNFFPDGSFAYCSTYSVNGQSVQGHRSGTWQMVEGYANPNQPGHYGGIVQLNISDGSAVRIGIEVLGNQGLVESGNASDTFAEGNFTRTEGGAAGC